jgi:putative Mg2+ transporter-C (MgtC) family protein
MLGDFVIFPFSALEEAEMLLRLALSALVGGMIGFERRRSASPAGIRTLALVAMGSATFTVISILRSAPSKVSSSETPPELLHRLLQGSVSSAQVPGFTCWRWEVQYWRW